MCKLVPNVPARTEKCVHRYRMFPALYRTASSASKHASPYRTCEPSEKNDDKAKRKQARFMVYVQKQDEQHLALLYTPSNSSNTAINSSVSTCRDTAVHTEQNFGCVSQFSPLGRTVERTVGRTRMSVYDLTQL